MVLSQKRYYEIDLVKTIAILSVVMIHICSLGRYYNIRTIPWYSTLFWRSAAAGAVPLFFMSNGVLLLDPQKPLTGKKLLLRRLPRLLVPLFFWATAYVFLDLALAGNLSKQTIMAGLQDVVLFRHKYHLYFIHIMLLVYVFLPLTRFFLQKAGKKELGYLMLLWFGLGIIYPTFAPLWPLRLVSGIPNQWAWNLTYCAIGYTILGYLIHKNPPSFMVCLGALLAGFAIIFGGTVYRTLAPGYFFDGFLNGNTLGVCLYSAGIFGLCCRRKGKMKPLSQKLVSFASEASFCVYLVHVFFISLFVQWNLSPDDFHKILSLPALTLLAIACSIPVYLILSHIPVLKKWLV